MAAEACDDSGLPVILFFDVDDAVAFVQSDGVVGNVDLLKAAIDKADQLIRFVTHDTSFVCDHRDWTVYWNAKGPADSNGMSVGIDTGIRLSDVRRATMFAARLSKAMETIFGPDFERQCARRAVYGVINGGKVARFPFNYQRCVPWPSWDVNGSVIDFSGEPVTVKTVEWDCEGLPTEYRFKPTHSKLIDVVKERGFMAADEKYESTFAVENNGGVGNLQLYVTARPLKCDHAAGGAGPMMLERRGGHVYVSCLSGCEGLSAYVTGDEPACCKLYAGIVDQSIVSYPADAVRHVVAEDLIVAHDPALAESLGLTVGGVAVPGGVFVDVHGVERIPPVPFDVLEKLTYVPMGGGQRCPLVAHCPTASGKTCTFAAVMGELLADATAGACVFATAFRLLVLATQKSIKSALESVKNPAVSALEVMHYKDDEIMPNDRVIVTCTNSIHLLPCVQPDYRLKSALIVDEINSTLGMNGDIIDYDVFTKIKKSIGVVIAKPTNMVLFSDAYFNSLSLAMLQSAGAAAPTIMTTRAKPYRKWEVQIRVTTLVSDGVHSGMKMAWVSDLMDFAKTGENVAVACSSQGRVEATVAFIRHKIEQGELPASTVVYGVHGDMDEVEKKRAVAYFENPGEGQLIFAFSACMGTGVSSPPGFFKYALYAAVGDLQRGPLDEQILQFLSRARPGILPGIFIIYIESELLLFPTKWEASRETIHYRGLSDEERAYVDSRMMPNAEKPERWLASRDFLQSKMTGRPGSPLPPSPMFHREAGSDEVKRYERQPFAPLYDADDAERDLTEGVRMSGSAVHVAKRLKGSNSAGDVLSRAAGLSRAYAEDSLSKAVFEHHLIMKKNARFTFIEELEQLLAGMVDAKIEWVWRPIDAEKNEHPAIVLAAEATNLMENAKKKQIYDMAKRAIAHYFVGSDHAIWPTLSDREASICGFAAQDANPKQERMHTDFDGAVAAAGLSMKDLITLMENGTMIVGDRMLRKLLTDVVEFVDKEAAANANDAGGADGVAADGEDADGEAADGEAVDKKAADDMPDLAKAPAPPVGVYPSSPVDACDQLLLNKHSDLRKMILAYMNIERSIQRLAANPNKAASINKRANTEVFLLAVREVYKHLKVDIFAEKDEDRTLRHLNRKEEDAGAREELARRIRVFEKYKDIKPDWRVLQVALQWICTNAGLTYESKEKPTKSKKSGQARSAVVRPPWYLTWLGFGKVRQPNGVVTHAFKDQETVTESRKSYMGVKNMFYN